MNRRNCIKNIGMLSTMPLFMGIESNKFDNGQYIYELRRYKFLSGKHKLQFNDYLNNAYIPALNRLGISPVGSFRPIYLTDSNIALYILIPFLAIDQAFLLNYNLRNDEEFIKMDAEYDHTTNDNPLFVSYDSSILLAFSNFPKIDLPDICIQKKKRYFNLRTYQSHSHSLLQRKIEMFNTDG